MLEAINFTVAHYRPGQHSTHSQLGHNAFENNITLEHINTRVLPHQARKFISDTIIDDVHLSVQKFPPEKNLK